jgi:hypothetical protein
MNAIGSRRAIRFNAGGLVASDRFLDSISNE